MRAWVYLVPIAAVILVAIGIVAKLLGRTHLPWGAILSPLLVPVAIGAMVLVIAVLVAVQP